MKGIPMKTWEVQAILDNRKTVFRRVVKPQPLSKLAYVCMGHKHGTWGYPDKDAWKYWEDESFRFPDGMPEPEREKRWTPPCHTGDILYVRETWCPFDSDHVINGVSCAYKADSTPESDRVRREFGYKWRSSTQMPQKAARIFLRVTEVRAERLQEIDDEGANAEGANWRNGKHVGFEDKMRHSAIDRFAEIWDSTIKPKYRALYGWDADPWVWVIEFERISKEEAMKCALKPKSCMT